jgi:tyrocidine synthetase III
MIISTFEQQVKQSAIRPAVQIGKDIFTYEQVNTHANRLAHAILEHFPPSSSGATQQVALLFEKGLDMIVSLLGVLKTGMAFVPLDISYPETRLSYMIEHSESCVIITNRRNQALAEQVVGKIDAQVLILIMEDLPQGLADTNPGIDIPANTRAYILYTSGSTGLPKGVVQNHSNVLYYVRNWVRVFQISPQDHMSMLTAFTHDGAMQDIFAALLNGALLFPFDIKVTLERQELSDFIQSQQISIWHSVPTLYRYFLEGIDTTYSFPHLRAIILGGEPLRKDDVTRFQTFFPDAQLANVYGQTESSVSTISVIFATDQFKKATLGEPLEETEILLVDEEDEIVEDIGSGEIVVSSPYLASGYWNDAEETQRKFVFDPDFGNMYFTGDLGAYLGSGDIEILGRKDFQVKIRGFRVETGEIESQLLQHPQIKEVVVREWQDEEEAPFLCAYLVPQGISKEMPDDAGLRDYLFSRLPDYMVPTRFITLDKMPHTATGKIDRNSLPEPGAGEPDHPFIAPQTDIEKQLARIWADVLYSKGTTHEPIGLEDNFFQLGGHSLRAMTVLSKVHKAFHVKLQLEDTFSYPLLKDLSDRIAQADSDTFHSIQPAEPQSDYPLSSAQKRLYVLQQMERIGTVYNIPVIMTLEGELDSQRVERVFWQLIQRHEGFRTSFFTHNDQPRQKVHAMKEVQFTIDYHQDESGSVHKTIAQEFIRPFDLSQVPLLRVGLIKIAQQEHIMMVDMHHIISDGTSLALMVREFMALYQGRELPSLRLRYADYCIWQNSAPQQDALKEKEAYWLDVFSGDIPVLDLPTDFYRPALQVFQGKRFPFQLDESQSESLKRLAVDMDVTLYMLLLGLYTIFLSKLSGQEDIVIGTPVAGRQNADLQDIVGMFVNTLAIRNRPLHNLDLNTYFKTVKETTIQAFNNQDYPFEDLVDRVCPSRDTGRNPLFDTVFTLQNFDARGSEIPEVEVPGIKLKPYNYENNIAKFDLMLTAGEGGDTISFVLEYCTRLFTSQTAERFSVLFKQSINNVLNNNHILLKDIQLISPEEKRQVLEDFNCIHIKAPTDKLLHHVFEEQVRHTPDRIALIGINPKHSITYRELNNQANRLTHYLKTEKGVRLENIVAMKMERSIDMIIAILGILKCGAAYLPIDPDYPQERIDYMLIDSGACLCLDENFYRTYQSNESNKLSLSEAFSLKKAGGETLAYIMYTSGTTGKPKGTMITHANVLRVVKQTNYIDIDQSDRMLQLSNYAFDGSTFDIYGALLNGASLLLVAKEDVPAVDRLAHLIKREAVTLFFITTALFNTLVEVDPQSLNSVRKILFGGERVSMTHSQTAIQHLGSGRLIHCYGPTESTVFATTHAIETVPPDASTIPIGKPITNTEIYILDANLQPVPIGVRGEIYIGGSGVARGYLNRPELTTQSFLIKRFAGSGGGFSKEPLAAGGTSRLLDPIYKTGDYGRWLVDGTVEFLGRTDHQVKIRGFRIELGEIESALMAFPGISDVVVNVVEIKKDKLICAYIVFESLDDEPPNNRNLRSFLSQSLPVYSIPAFYIFLKALPLTSNGKIDRRMLPVPETIQGDHYTPASDRVEEQLVKLWSDILGVEQSSIGIDDDFFQLGGHSLKATILSTRIHKLFQVALPLTIIFQSPTIRDIAHYIRGAGIDVRQSPIAAEKRDYYLLSSPQQRLYILQQLDPENTGYNIPTPLVLEGRLEVERITQAFTGLINRHESLRTSFLMKDKLPVQRIHETLDFSIDFFHDLSSSIILRQVKDYIRPFDLSIAPLMRVALIKVKEEEHKHILIVDMHHIISDGTSIGLLIDDFMALYRGADLAPLTLSYVDYAQWQNSDIQKAAAIQHETFWLDRFKNDIPVLELPLDFERPDVQSFAGANFGFELALEQNIQLKQLALQENATLFMVLLALFNVLLSKLSNNEDIVIGSPTAGRGYDELQGIVGMFINTLALRHTPSGEIPFRHFLQQVKEGTLNAFENQDYQFEDLVERLGDAVSRNTGRNPLFDVLFTLQNLDIPDLEIPGLKLKSYDWQMDRAKFDLSLQGVEAGERLFLTFQYCTHLFKEESIQAFARYFQQLVSSVLADNDCQLHKLSILSLEERQRLLTDCNQESPAPISQKQTIHHMFAQQVLKNPESIAVTGIEDQSGSVAPVLAYARLNQWAENVAVDLQQKGVLQGDIVALRMEPSLNMIASILGILKAGAGYLPINPDLPQERIDFMLLDSGAKLTINEEYSEPDLSHVARPTVVSGPDLAYIIYTSGTTGKPKGVMIQHRNVVHLMINSHPLFHFDKNDVWTMFHSYGFDFSVWEMYGALCFGGRLVLVSKETARDPALYWQLLCKHSVTVLNQTPRAFYALAEEALKCDVTDSNLRVVIFGGEALNPTRLKRWQQRFPALRLVNMFGITETTVHVTFKELSGQELRSTSSNIGKPLPGWTLFILDTYRQLTAPGVAGEIWVGGAGVARGYLNRPELTKQRFVQDLPEVNGRFYRSGDLGRWLPNGEIEYLGRIDHQVKIRGFRIELEEIENRLLAHDLIDEVVVIDRKKKDDDNYLCAYLVLINTAGSDAIGDTLKNYLARFMPDYMVPSFFVPLPRIPLTLNGKVDRFALPEPLIGTEPKAKMRPRNETEETLTRIFADILGTGHDGIGIDADFFQLGGHSLKAVSLVNAIHKSFHVKIDIGTVFQSPSIRELAELVLEKGNTSDPFLEIQPLSLPFYQLSYAQKRIWVIQQMNPQSPVFNMPITVFLEKGATEYNVHKVLQQLVERHDCFRTHFRIEEEVVQVIAKETELYLETEDLGHLEEEAQRAYLAEQMSFVSAQVFDLESVQLYRVKLWLLGGGTGLLFFNIHHIVFDGWSLELLQQEFLQRFNALLEGRAIHIQPLRIQYKDYAHWHNRLLSDGNGLTQAKEFWKEMLSGSLPVLSLPYDYASETSTQKRSASFRMVVPQSVKEALTQIAHQHNASLFMVLLAGFNMLLAHLSGHDDIILALPGAARQHEDLEKIMGLFVNTLILRNHVQTDLSFIHFLEDTREKTMQVLEYQSYPLELICEELNIAYPQLSVFFNKTDMGGQLDQLTDLDSAHMNATQDSKFDLSFYVSEYVNGINIACNYFAHLFEPVTVERIVTIYTRILANIAADPGQKVSSYHKSAKKRKLKKRK